MIDTIVMGAGPAGVLAALRAADLGARTMLVTRAEFGGMAANDGPVPVRTLSGDDVELKYCGDDYPKLPTCLDRRRKPEPVAEAAA